jgi:hypothetical protein
VAVEISARRLGVKRGEDLAQKGTIGGWRSEGTGSGDDRPAVVELSSMVFRV